MEQQKNEMSNIQWVIHALLTGNRMKSRDIAEMISELAGREIKVQDVASILSRISDSEKCDLGYFIHRAKGGVGFTYSLVKEALPLSESQVYGLTLKTGKNRYTLEATLQAFPELRKYVEQTQSEPPEPEPKFRIMKKMTSIVNPPKFFNVKPMLSTTQAQKNMEITLRYSEKYSLSISSSVSIFMLICLMAILTVVAICMAIYWFFFPFFIVMLIIGVIYLAVLFLRNKR